MRRANTSRDSARARVHVCDVFLRGVEQGCRNIERISNSIYIGNKRNQQRDLTRVDRFKGKPQLLNSVVHHLSV